MVRSFFLFYFPIYEYFVADREIEDDTDDEKVDAPDVSQSSTSSNRSLSTSSSFSSSTSISSTTSSSSSISRLAVQAILTPDPRCSSPQRQERPRPTPIASGTSLAEPSMPKTFYQRSVAESRKNSGKLSLSPKFQSPCLFVTADIDFLEYFFEIQRAGLLEGVLFVFLQGFHLISLTRGPCAPSGLEHRRSSHSSSPVRQTRLSSLP